MTPITMNAHLARAFLGLMLIGCTSREPDQTLAPCAPTVPEAAQPRRVPDVLATVPPTQLSGLDVRWVPEELPDFTGEEVEDPWRREVPADKPSEWRVYVVRDETEPELMVETRRYVDDLSWTQPGCNLLAHFSSFAKEPWAGPEIYPSITGLWRFEVGDKRASLTEEWIPQAFLGLSGPSPSGEFAALEVRTPRLAEDARGTPSFYRGMAVDVYLLTGQKRLRLEGLPGNKTLSWPPWSPDGTMLVVRSEEQGVRSDYYLVPRDDGFAVLLEAGANKSISRVWSPDGNRLAYRARGNPGVYVYDRGSATQRLLATDLPAKTSGPLLWTKDGRQLIAGNVIIDVETGKANALPLSAEEVVHIVESPDGKYLAINAQVSNYPSCPWNSTRTYLFHRQSGELRPLTECRKDVFLSWANFPTWVSENFILLTWANRSELASIQLELMNIHDGDVLLLTDGLEPLAHAELSPTRDRVLVSGNRLRLYTSNGRLLRAVSPPSGFDVARIAWSPDGSMFAYVLGPAGFRCCL